MPTLSDLANLEEVVEGTTRLLVPKSTHVKGPKAKEGLPFYNPAMRLARDLSVLVLGGFISQGSGKASVCDAMSSLGARGIRFANEIPGTHVLLNDVNLDAVTLAKRNTDRLELRNCDFRMGRLETLLADNRFDWVDVDPYGTPAPFLDVAVGAVLDGGVLAVTATDKPALCGVYPEVCQRRYNARPLHQPIMWEVATRILMGAVARAAGRRDRFIEPMLSHSTEHYVRVYARIRDGAEQANRDANNSAYAWIDGTLARHFEARPPPQGDYAGPLWAGPLSDTDLIDRLIAKPTIKLARDATKLLALLREESEAPPLYYTIDEFTRAAKTDAPRLDRLVDALRNEGHVAARTHFTPRGIKTDAPPEAIRKTLPTR